MIVKLIQNLENKMELQINVSLSLSLLEPIKEFSKVAEYKINTQELSR